MKIRLSILLFLLMPTAALADSGPNPTGSALQTMCREPHATFGAGFCLGYIAASAQQLALSGKLCLAGDVTNARLVSLTEQYMTQNAGKLDEIGVATVYKALRPQFDCTTITPNVR